MGINASGDVSGNVVEPPLVATSRRNWISREVEKPAFAFPVEVCRGRGSDDRTVRPVEGDVIRSGAEISAPEDCSKAETWAWAEIRAGRTADFNVRFGPLHPKTPEGWDDRRKLGQAFLKTILLDDPFRSAIPRQGVRIFGAWFPEPIDLENARVEHELELVHSRFEATVNLTDMKIRGLLSLGGSGFGGKLDMDRLQADSNLFMLGGAEFAEVVLGGARVGGQLDMTGSRFGGKLNMDSVQVDGSLFMRGGAEFAEVILNGAKVGGQLSMNGSRFGGGWLASIVMQPME